MLLTVALGSPSEEILQDTLKSSIVSVLGIIAAMLVYSKSTDNKAKIIWHKIIFLPISLVFYAAASSIWSHHYLGLVELARWFIFSIVLFVTLNISTSTLKQRVFPGIHWGVTIASLWAVLQFVGDFQFFAQGPNPASTFVNRNFFAEFAICALPYSIYLLIDSKRNSNAVSNSISIGIVVTAILMTGTRSALVALIFLIFFILIILWHFWCIKKSHNNICKNIFSNLIIILITVSILGSIPTGNSKIASEFGTQSAIGRALTRTSLISTPSEYKIGSFALRVGFWKTTIKMIEGNPLLGVGAGAWEVFAPLYQEDGTQIEADFYAHNEFLQLVAEYGATGWLFILMLIAYLLKTALTIFKSNAFRDLKITEIRITAIFSLLMLAIVSNAGFPWRLAATGSLFAISIGVLARCDAHTNQELNWMVKKFSPSKYAVRTFLVIGTIFFTICIYVIQRGVVAEKNLVRGIKLSLLISRSGSYDNPFWDDAKKEMVVYLHRGVTANPHYRKLTAIAADELANMGDWKNALWVWESLHTSRPYVVAIIANIARAKLALDDIDGAETYLDKARKLQPKSDAVKNLNVLVMVRKENFFGAAEAVESLFRENKVDFDVVNAAYLAAQKTSNWALAIESLNWQIKLNPRRATTFWLEIGQIYDQKIRPSDPKAAQHAFDMAIFTSGAAEKQSTRMAIPNRYKN
jgi:O-antigen ligase